ncbi:hypothetical protein KY338_06455 [Candidatus Woesearchaeota archaeon]|nr:hypothetical protein [Candidatus Woesearchaeota archaeon]MBW3006464.1 hypothetical protein [Candidatus Woesearchaeota archaeon]
MGSLIRKILSYVGVPTEEEIAQRIQAAEETARKSTIEEFDSRLEQIAKKHTQEVESLRKGLLEQDALARQDERIKERIAKLRALEKKASAASDGISAREVRLITEYAKGLDSELRLTACDLCDTLLVRAQEHGWKLSMFKQTFINNFYHFDEHIGDNKGYKMLNWIATDFLTAEKRTLEDAGTLLKYFRELINSKGGTEDVSAKIDKCISDPKYYDRIKTNAKKKVQETEEQHKRYVQELDELSRNLLEERGAKGSFETLIEESRRGQSRIVLGSGGIASRITRMRAMREYEKRHNINLYDYKNQEAL